MLPVCFILSNVIQELFLQYRGEAVQSTAYPQRGYFFVCRDTIMAATPDSTHKERARPGRAVPAHLQGHHGPEAAYRVGRQQRR